jgi:hypothetical protein
MVGAHIAGTDSLSEFGSDLEWCVDSARRSFIFAALGGFRWFVLQSAELTTQTSRGVACITYQGKFGRLGLTAVYSSK